MSSPIPMAFISICNNQTQSVIIIFATKKKINIIFPKKWKSTKQYFLKQPNGRLNFRRFKKKLGRQFVVVYSGDRNQKRNPDHLASWKRTTGKTAKLKYMN